MAVADQGAGHIHPFAAWVGSATGGSVYFAQQQILHKHGAVNARIRRQGSDHVRATSKPALLSALVFSSLRQESVMRKETSLGSMK